MTVWNTYVEIRKKLFGLHHHHHIFHANRKNYFNVHLSELNFYNLLATSFDKIRVKTTNIVKYFGVQDEAEL